MRIAVAGPPAGARICMPTWRRFSRKVFECGLYEAQDVLASTGDVHLLPLEAANGFRTRERWLNRILHREPWFLLGGINPGLEPIWLDRDYDLLLTFCESFEDLLYLNAVRNWKQRCRTSVCWVDEIWATSLANYRFWMPIFRQFDHVFVCHRQSATALSAVLGRPVHFLPAAADTLRFTPFTSLPSSTQKSVDVYSVGRRAEGIHRELRRLATNGQFHYVFDTFKAAVADVYDPAQHRDLLANIAKRSRFFLVAPPKFDALTETGGETAIGFRYFEGSAAGSVLLGQRCSSEDFDTLFDWPDAVVEVRPDGTDLEPTLAALQSEPARVAAIGRRNGVEALRRHDWIYRWHEILDRVGLTIPPGMFRREAQLRRLAAMAEGAAPPSSDAAFEPVPVKDSTGDLRDWTSDFASGQRQAAR